MKKCTKCGLSEALFSVTLDSDGVCNYCLNHKKEQKKVNKDIGDHEDIQLKDIVGKGKYDVLLAYSGGKDSTYLLYMLRKIYNLKVLTMTLDNGFLSQQTYKNIKTVTAALDADNIMIAPSKQKLIRMFQFAEKEAKIPMKSLERASSICTYCIGIVKSCAYEQAIINEIPLITFGWTPGQVQPLRQIIKLSPEMVNYNFKWMRKNLSDRFDHEFDNFFIDDEFIQKNKDKVPYQFYPYCSDNYNEADIIKLISRYGWELPTDTDSNSSNCVLNTYAISKHVEKYQFHPYEFELCGLVRENLLSLDEMKARIEKPLKKEIIEYVQSEFDQYPID